MLEQLGSKLRRSFRIHLRASGSRGGRGGRPFPQCLAHLELVERNAQKDDQR